MLVLHLGGDALGSLAVIVSALIIMAGGPAVADPAASLFIAILLALAGFRLLGGIIHLLSEGVPAGISLGAVSAALHAIPRVKAVHDLHVWALAEDLPLSRPTSRPTSAPTGTRSCRRRRMASDGSGWTTRRSRLEPEPCGQGRPAAARPIDRTDTQPHSTQE